MIQDVENLGAKFDVLRFRKLRALVENQIELSEVGSFQRVAQEVPEDPRQRNRDADGLRKLRSLFR